MARYPHILFDLDGTLIDSAPAILASFREAFAQTGIAPVRSIDESIIGPPLLETLQLLSGSQDAALTGRLADAFKASYDIRVHFKVANNNDGDYIVDYSSFDPDGPNGPTTWDASS